MEFDQILSQYALPVILMAMIVMALVGFIKIFTKMIPNKKANETGNESKLSKVMSYFYVLFSVALTIGVVCIYYHCFLPEVVDNRFLEIAKTSAAVFACTQALYPIYRDYGGRFILNKVLEVCKKLFRKNKNTKAEEIINIIEQVLVLTDTQKSKIEDQLNEKL